MEVKPITWMVDEKANIALSKKIIFSGVQFDNKRNYTGDFENTDIYNFMVKYFSKDIIPSVIDKTIDKETIEHLKTRIQELEQLLQESQEEQGRLCARETELDAQLEQMQAQIEGKGQYVKQ